MLRPSLFMMMILLCTSSLLSVLTLYAIFGDAQWTNSDRLSDATLRDLVEHFSSLTLSIANVPEDELGLGGVIPNQYEHVLALHLDLFTQPL